MRFPSRHKTILFLLFIFPALGQAQDFSTSRASKTMGDSIYFEETFFPVYVHHNDTSSVTTAPGVATESGLGYDFRTTAGYVLFDHVLLGATYNLYHLKTKRPYVSGGEEGLEDTTDATEFGPSLGYVYGGWRTVFTYFVSGSKREITRNFNDSGTTTQYTVTNKSLSGFQIDLGYAFQIFDFVRLGPSLLYKTTTYSKQSRNNPTVAFENYSDVSLYSKLVKDELSGMVTLIAQF